MPAFSKALFEALTLSLSILLNLFFTSLNFTVQYLWDVLIISTTIVQQLRNNAIWCVLHTFLFTEFVTFNKLQTLMNC